MKKINVSRLSIVGLSIGVLAVVGVACGGGVSEDDFNALQMDVSTVESTIENLADRAETLENRAQMLLEAFTTTNPNPGLSVDSSGGPVSLENLQNRLAALQVVADGWEDTLEALGDNVPGTDASLANDLMTSIGLVAGQLESAIAVDMVASALPALASVVSALENQAQMLTDRLEAAR